ncbi:hypothetical protein V6N11_053565 [Hibiscus sabdariffa]|uniref:Uncharacterized protein n=1 Tax=Hibiscus sabdariffa TaxID=183260 RepID=A0ABR2UDP6_9ROSI
MFCKTTLFTSGSVDPIMGVPNKCVLNTFPCLEKTTKHKQKGQIDQEMGDGSMVEAHIGTPVLGSLYSEVGIKEEGASTKQCGGPRDR